MKKERNESRDTEGPTPQERELKAKIELLQLAYSARDTAGSMATSSTQRLEIKEDEPVKTRRQRRSEYQQALATLQETEQRKWLEHHGAGKFVPFNDE
jgi:hypothetical protein